MVLAIDGYSTIIDTNFKDFCSIEETIDDNMMNGFLEVCSEEIKTTLITQFGLSQFFDHFKDGGNVATVHNAKKDIFPDKQIEMQFKEIYNRKNYDQKLPEIRKREFKKDKDIKSYLTNKTLKKDGSTHADHIVSAKEIHSNNEARLYMDKKERSDMAQSNENIQFLESNINQSKNDKDLINWKNTVRGDNDKTNQDHFNVNKKQAKKYHKDAHKFLNKEMMNKKVNIIKSAGIKQGFDMGKKQVIGIFIYESIDLFFIMSSDLINKWKKSITIDEKISAFKETLLDSINITIFKFEKIKSTIIQTFFTGVSSGFIANILTFLINQVMTTCKLISKVLNDSIYALIRAFKLMAKRPKEMSFKEACREAIKIVAAAITASTGVILTEGIKKFLLTTPLAPFANEMSIVIGATLTGIITALVLYLIDNYRQVIVRISYEMNLIMKYTKVTKREIEQAYLNTLYEVDEIYNKVLIKILDEYRELNRLMNLAYDFNQLASVTFNNSIKYSEYSGVNKKNILCSLSEIDDFFLN